MGKRCLKAVLILYAVYGIASFIFLNFILVNWITRSTDEVRIKYRFAYSLFPGHVWLSHFSLGVQDSNMQLYCEMPSVSVSVRLLPLFRKEFKVLQTRSEYLKFYFRLRRSAEEMPSVALSALPPIPFAPLIVKGPEETSEEVFSPWKIEIKNIDIKNVTELWFEEFRFLGVAGIKGGFYLHPKTLVEVFPSEIDIRDGGVTVSGVPLLREFNGNVKGKVFKFTPDEVPRLSIFKRVQGDVHLEGEIGSISFINYYLRHLPQLHFEEGQGKGELKLVIQDGVFSKNSFMTLDANNLKVKVWDHVATGKGEIRWNITPKEENELSVKVSPFTFAAQNNSELKIEGETCEIIARVDGREIDVPSRKIDWEVRLPEAKLIDLRYVNRFLPSGSKLRFIGGEARVKVFLRSNLQATQGDSGSLELRTSQGRFAFGEKKYDGDITAQVKIQTSNFSKGKIQIPLATIRIKDLGLVTNELKKLIEAGWKSSVKLRNTLVEMGAEPTIRTQIEVDATDAAPFINLAGQSGNVPGWLASVFPLSDLNAVADVFSTKESVEVLDILLDSSNASVVGWVKHQVDHGVNLKLLVKASPISVGVETKDNKNTIRFHEAEKWYYETEGH